jgi:FG-GAP-like repeat
MKTTIACFLLLGAIGCNGVKIASEVDIRLSFVASSAITDLDGDDEQDVIIADFDKLLLVPIQGGQFGAPTEILTFSDAEIRVVDVGGDGLPELVTASGGAVEVRENQGAFSFAAPVSLATNLLFGSFVLDNVSGDELPEIVGLINDPINNTPLVAIFPNNGGAFDLNPITLQNPDNNFAPSSLRAGDFDNDGDLDIFQIGIRADEFSGEQQLRVVTNNGDDTFTMSADLLSLGTLGFSAPGGTLSVADVDKDGDVDFAFVGFDQNFLSQLFLIRNDSGDLVRVELPVGAQGVTGVQLIDVDQDQDLDLVTTTREDEVFGYQTESLEVFINDTDFTLESHQVRNIDGMSLLGGSDQRPALFIVGNTVDFITSTLFAVELR